MPYGTINAGTIAPGSGNTLTIDGAWTAASQTCANLGTVTTTGTIGLGGKLTAGSTEIEGSNFDINGGTLGAITIDGNWTAASQTCADLGTVTTANIDGGTIDGVTSFNGTEIVTPATNNLGIGIDAVDSITTGDYNVGVGDNALTANTTGNYCNAFGTNALDSSTAGDRNNAFGYNSLTACNSGDTGGGNTAMGDFTAYQLTTGRWNTCVGYWAGSNMTSGADNNLLLGRDSGTSGSPSGNITGGSHIVCLGDNAIVKLYCAEDVDTSSDSRDKTDVEDFTPGLAWVEAMRPVTFHWDKRAWYIEKDEETGEVTSQSEPDGTHKKDKKNLGFIAQEVLEIEQAHGFASDENDMLTISLNEDDTAYTMKYAKFVPVLVNAIKELSAKVTALESA